MNTPALKRLQAENLALLERKNAAYGSQNIELTGLTGVTVRLLDKVMRLKTLVIDGHADHGDEAVADTLRDIANYALIAQALETGEWNRPATDPRPRPLTDDELKAAISRAGAQAAMARVKP